MQDERKIVGVSGGKDSTAVCLHLLEQGYSKGDFDRVFLDTGWEHPETYNYLNELESTIGEIKRLRVDIEVKEEDKDIIQSFENRLGFVSPFIRLVFKYNAFPSSIVKWCTRQLKIEPLKKYYDTLDYDFVNVVGIRKEESRRRSKMEELEWNEGFDCWTWRPLIDWTFDDVISIHHRFNLRPNHLYLTGSHRVGCFPCINANKRAINNLDSTRVSIIKDLEKVISERRNKKGKNNASFFKNATIEEAVQWSKTTRGGKQFFLFEKEEPSCVRWGMCGV